MRAMSLVLLMSVAIAMSAQSSPDIVSSINRSSNVSITLPDGLTERSNSDLNKSGKAKTETADETKTETTDDAKRVVDPRTQRAHTNSQTIQGRTVGYRIQAFNEASGNAKAGAQERARAIAMKFPQYRTYISYNAPTWRLRVGDFKNQGDAQAALSRIRSIFPQFSGMILVRDNINVWSK